MRRMAILAAVMASTGLQRAYAASLNPDLSGLGFLIGSWRNGDGKVAETGGVSKGQSIISVEAGGAVLLRRDHTELFDKAGKPAGTFDQIMTIYRENGSIRADYFDGTHIIHYASAQMVPGRSVMFSSAPAGPAPTFRLTYQVNGPVLSITFGMVPPGSTAFRPIATGTLRKQG